MKNDKDCNENNRCTYSYVLSKIYEFVKKTNKYP